MPAARHQSRHMVIAVMVWVFAGLGVVLIGHAQEATAPDPTAVTIVPVVGPVTGVIPRATESSCPVPFRTC